MTDEHDPWRFCVYCKVDCYVDEPEHAADCPSSTGVYQVRYEACHPPCQHCGKRPDPSMLCAECECILGLGDSYTHREIGENVREVICLGCAAQEVLT